MSYCVNPSCPHPKNPDNATVCQACGSKLRLKDRYQILGILGKGGFGATFATVDMSLPGNPLCVVKQLRPSSEDPNVFRMAKQLFEREAETLGRVGNHPQVPRLLDYFEENKHFYLVQEYVKGHNLHQEVKKSGPFTETGVKQFLSELLPIIKYIHAQKVIHRDIKPANLIRRQTDKKLVLIDFGAVKNQVNTIVANNNSEQSAFTAFAVGTAGFAPPEQMAMRPVYASDLYAVGVTAVYLLTGKSPKEMNCDPETGELIWETWVQIDESLATVLKKLLEVSVKHRYKSAQEVLDALEMSDYTTSLEESMVTMANLKPEEKSSGYSSEMSQMPPRNSKIVTRINSGMMTSSWHRNSPTPTPSGLGAAPDPAAGMGFQVANNVGINRTKNKKQLPGLKKKSKLDAKFILDSYGKGRRDFAQQELNGLNLQKAKLSGANFYQSQMIRVNLQGADLTSADLGRSNLSQAVLKNTNFNQAYMGYTNLERADLRGADLTGAHLKYANLRGANLCGANLLDALVTEEQLSQAKTNWLTIMPSGKRGFW